MIEFHIIKHRYGYALKKRGAKRATEIHWTIGEAIGDAIQNRKADVVVVHNDDATVNKKIVIT